MCSNSKLSFSGLHSVKKIQRTPLRFRNIRANSGCNLARQISLSTVSREVVSHCDPEPREEASQAAGLNVTVRDPLFFNYHEFSESYYAETDDPQKIQEHGEDNSLCITHFPNVYVARCSLEFQTTRIVRIPRRYETTLDCPVLSTMLPGSEPGAIPGDISFQPQGYLDEDGQLFGHSSVSPLSDFLSQQQFEEIVASVNNYLTSAFYIYSWFNLTDFFLELVSLGLWRLVSKYVVKHPLLDLEDYVVQINEKHPLKEQGVKIISPRRSGYLSLDFQIPRPSV